MKRIMLIGGPLDGQCICTFPASIILMFGADGSYLHDRIAPTATWQPFES